MDGEFAGMDGGTFEAVGCRDEDGGLALYHVGLDLAGLVTFIKDHGHVHGSCRSELTDYLGENPGGNLGTAHANPCCWLTPIRP